MTTLTEDTIITGEAAYTDAIDLVLAKAESQLLIFDQDLSTGGYASMARYQLIRDFLARDAVTQLTMILHRSDYLSQRCPKLFALLETFSHKMTVYITSRRAHNAKDCFILADQQHYIRRFHIDQARFKYALGDAKTTHPLVMRFDELKETISKTLSANKLGL